MTCEALKRRIDPAGEEPGLEAEVGGLKNAAPRSFAGWQQAAAVVVVGLLLGFGALVSASDYEPPPPLTRIQ